MSNNVPKCPKCGHVNIYVGATEIECGMDSTCENYTKTQAKVVEQILASKFPSAKNICNDEDDTLELERDDNTDPMFGIPLDYYDDGVAD